MRRFFININSLRQYDWILVVLVLILLVFSFASIYSIDLSRGDTLVYFPVQLLAALIGFGFLLAAARFHMTFYQAMARPIYVLSILLLIAVLLFADPVRGTTGWFKIGGLSFQPAEFTKFSLILMMGFLISLQGRRFYKLQFIVLSGLLTALPIGLVLLQPDLGSSLVLGGIWFGALVLSGVKKRYIVALLAAVALVFFVSWSYLFADYQKDRLLIFLHPEKELLGAGYNVNQSIIAIGAGRLFGRGLGFGSQSQLQFLPEAQTDFIFSVIAEELGFAAALIIIILYTLLFLRLIRIAGQCRDDFSSYVILGITLLFFIQIVFNLGSTTGLLPVTGLTLPFLSYGGSSLMINLLLIGIAESIARSNWENQKENVLYG